MLQQNHTCASLESLMPPQEDDVPSQLKSKFPGGFIWIDCGISLQVQFPSFGIEIKEKALKIARDLGASSQEEEANKVGSQSSHKLQWTHKMCAVT